MVSGAQAGWSASSDHSCAHELSRRLYDWIVSLAIYRLGAKIVPRLPDGRETLRAHAQRLSLQLQATRLRAEALYRPKITLETPN